ncbi:unnamed protein product [Litomosoides sigmodontis]|uniref:Uncharacterized protein n=1 Tax=Litomosoides sigmodontis TaxID=42156 RepID=A0A3P6TTS8_LITSI|nr:unnamed protein product [Litomosoides sigmodontis]
MLDDSTIGRFIARRISIWKKRKKKTNLISDDDDAFRFTAESSSLTDNGKPEHVAITYDMGRRRRRH